MQNISNRLLEVLKLFIATCSNQDLMINSTFSLPKAYQEITEPLLTQILNNQLESYTSKQ